jgi:hypothetical protein
MRNRLAVLVVVVGLFLGVIGFSGCAGMSQNVPVNIATDVAFVMALDKYPATKPGVVKGLQVTKALLSGQLTYDTLMIELLKTFGNEYKYVYIIISGYIAADKPTFESWLNLTDAYKAEVIKKIDRLLLLAGTVW